MVCAGDSRAREAVVRLAGLFKHASSNTAPSATMTIMISKNNINPSDSNHSDTSSQYLPALIKDMRDLTQKLDSFHLFFSLGWESRCPHEKRQHPETALASTSK
jgi:hypothetical protein